MELGVFFWDRGLNPDCMKIVWRDDHYSIVTPIPIYLYCTINMQDTLSLLPFQHQQQGLKFIIISLNGQRDLVKKKFPPGK